MAPNSKLISNAESSGRVYEESEEEEPMVSRGDALADFIPPHLEQFVTPYHGDFCFSPWFHYRLIASLMAEGFLPMATSVYNRGNRQIVLLPKLHQERSLIRLDRNELHISKSTRKKSKRYTMTLNKDWDGVVQGCHEQHGDTCWLYEPLVEAFTELRERRDIPVAGGDSCSVQLYSVQVYNADNELVAGELGYTVGRVYTSLTGFSREDSSGSVQLAALGSLLIQNGIALWDLGMDMDYKASLGAKLVSRPVFVDLLHRYRQEEVDLPEKQVPCRNVINSLVYSETKTAETAE